MIVLYIIWLLLLIYLIYNAFIFFKRKKLPYKITIIVIFILSILTVFVINESYKMNMGYFTLWGANDVLAFYGSFLGFVGTTSLGIISLYQTKKANDVNKKLADRQLELINYEYKLNRLNKINDIFTNLLRNIDMMVVNKINYIGALEDVLSLRDEFQTALKNVELGKISLDLTREFVISCDSVDCENCKKVCDYKSISEPLKEEMSQIRIEYYNFSTQYFNIVGNIVNKLNKVIQSNHYSNETQKLMFRLKEMENEMTSASDKLIILQLISNFNNYNFFNEYKEIYEKELTEKVKGNEHERKMIKQLLDYYKLNNYDLTRFNQEVLSEDNIAEINKMNGNYIALRDKIIKCQNLIQYEIEILKNQLK